MLVIQSRGGLFDCGGCGRCDAVRPDSMGRFGAFGRLWRFRRFSLSDDSLDSMVAKMTDRARADENCETDPSYLFYCSKRPTPITAGAAPTAHRRPGRLPGGVLCHHV